MPTRHPISWSELAGAKAGVFGLGIEGTANLRKLLDLGAEVVVVEDDPPPGEALGQEVLRLDGGGIEALRRMDVVVKAPGVPRRRPEVVALEEAGVPVLGGLGLWMQEAPLDKVLAITGTKGKSTTTALAGHILEHFGYSTLVGGNIGRVPYDPALPAEFDYAVVEMSSYQATDLAISPPVVAVTSLHPDHLDWHGGVEEYFTDKLSACSQPGADLTVADGTSALLRGRRGLLGPRVQWVGGVGGVGGEPGAAASAAGPGWLDALPIPGAHNRENALIARACLAALGVPEVEDGEALAGAVAGFGGLESRLRPIGEVAGVTFVDDSLSTNVLPTLAALDAYAAARVALVAGGRDRGIDYAPLGEALAGRGGASEVAVFTLPDNGPRIAGAVREAAPGLEVTECRDLGEAVRRGFEWARRGGGVVLLSPAAPSYGHFRDYRERASVFAGEMDRCIRGERQG